MGRGCWRLGAGERATKKSFRRNIFVSVGVVLRAVRHGRP